MRSQNKCLEEAGVNHQPLNVPFNEKIKYSTKYSKKLIKANYPKG